ncbi:MULTISPECIES: hypothetical protein [unclassified Streptomyces]|uniref:hypothetical protein n=1 Tax=unclassified Streptomyces TaxID=2593676 RepID=UPI0004BDD7EE|nr:MULTISPECIES: hypothetical protein [unclassified Streptomyces]
MAGVSTVNVSDSAVHATYRPGTPLARTGRSGTLRIHALPVSGPAGLAIRGDRLLLLGGNERGITTHIRVNALHHIRLTDDGAVVVGREDLVFPNGDPRRGYARPVSRGSDIFLSARRTLRQWWVLTAP